MNHAMVFKIYSFKSFLLMETFLLYSPFHYHCDWSYHDPINHCHQQNLTLTLTKPYLVQILLKCKAFSGHPLWLSNLCCLLYFSTCMATSIDYISCFILLFCLFPASPNWSVNDIEWNSFLFLNCCIPVHILIDGTYRYHRFAQRRCPIKYLLNDHTFHLFSPPGWKISILSRILENADTEEDIL